MSSTTLHGPTLSKLGADLRWFLEQNGVDAERVVFSISVKTKAEQERIISGFYRSFDHRTMVRHDKYPEAIWLHSIPMWVIVDKPKESA